MTGPRPGTVIEAVAAIMELRELAQERLRRHDPTYPIGYDEGQVDAFDAALDLLSGLPLMAGREGGR